MLVRFIGFIYFFKLDVLKILVRVFGSYGEGDIVNSYGIIRKIYIV